jgi:hypothetical protein
VSPAPSVEGGSARAIRIGGEMVARGSEEMPDALPGSDASSRKRRASRGSSPARDRQTQQQRVVDGCRTRLRQHACERCERHATVGERGAPATPASGYATKRATSAALSDKGTPHQRLASSRPRWRPSQSRYLRGEFSF